MKRFISVLFVLVFSAIASFTPLSVAQADSLTPAQALERLFTQSPPEEDWFTPRFLQQVPLPQIEAILTDLKKNLGNYQNIEQTNNQYQVILEQGKIPTQIVLNEQGQISGLFFQPPVLNQVDLKTIVEQLKALPGEVSLLIGQGNQPLVDLNSQKPLAVGSAFKLAVLAALQEKIAGGELAWDQVFPLAPEWKSLPSGILQSWPDQTPLTVQTLATLMISMSDNTATDALIQIIGRENIEKFSPRNRPFLTTKEAFILKNPQNEDWLQRYRQGNLAEKRQILAQIQELPLPDVNLFTGDGIALDIEWFFSSQELCQLMAKVADLPLMQVNPGVAKPEDWQQISFKGGSEGGVLNLTTQVSNEEGVTSCVVLTQNDQKALDELQIITLYQQVIQSLQSPE